MTCVDEVRGDFSEDGGGNVVIDIAQADAPLNFDERRARRGVAGLRRPQLGDRCNP
jgi:hypothetical protein